MASPKASFASFSDLKAFSNESQPLSSSREKSALTVNDLLIMNSLPGLIPKPRIPAKRRLCNVFSAKAPSCYTLHK